jgi:hypothetical protein
MAQLYEIFEPGIQAPFEQNTYGAQWGADFGEVKDQLMNSMKLGVLARFPFFAPIDALGEIAEERGMYQGLDETIAHFIARLLNAWGAWSIGGTYWGLLAQLAGAGYTTAYIVAANGYIYGPSSGVVVPDPINGLAGTPPAFLRIPPWYTFGSAQSGNEWAGDTIYALNAVVTPTAQPGTYFLATQGGETAGSEPTWPGPGGSVVDGTVTWTYLGNYTALPYYPPWTFSGADGQGDPGSIIGPTPGSGIPDPTGSFWSRFMVFFGPVGSSLPTGDPAKLWVAPTYPAWQATTAYSTGDFVTPVSPDGSFFVALTGGTSGSSEPAWPEQGSFITDGSVLWTYGGNFLANPPTTTTTPTTSEISLLQDIIAKWKPAKSICGGIAAFSDGQRACFGWPLTTTTHMPVSSWLARAVIAGDVPNASAFTPEQPQSIYSWLPAMSAVNAGTGSYMFMVPSAYYQTQNLGGGYLFSSPASSGTTGYQEPTWPTTLGDTVSDGTITWTCIAQLDAWGDDTGATIFSA